MSVTVGSHAILAAPLRTLTGPALPGPFRTGLLAAAAHPAQRSGGPAQPSAPHPLAPTTALLPAEPERQPSDRGGQARDRYRTLLAARHYARSARATPREADTIDAPLRASGRTDIAA
jgi:hypothetical protein